MALTKTVELYETLARYENGKVRGMQVQYITKYYDDGVFVTAKVSDAEKVAVLDGDAVGKKLAEDVHTPQALALQKTNDVLEATIAEKEVIIAEKDAIIAEKEKDKVVVKEL